MNAPTTEIHEILIGDKNTIVFDWHDKAKEGVFIVIESELVFWFEEIYSSELNGLYYLHHLSAGSYQYILNILKPLGNPNGRVWIPIWSHENQEALEFMDSELDKVKQASKDKCFVIEADLSLNILRSWISKSYESIKAK